MQGNKYMTPYLVQLLAEDPPFMSHVTPYIVQNKQEYRRSWANKAFVRHPYLESFPPAQVEKNWQAAVFIGALPEKKLLEILADCFPRLRRIYARGSFSVYCKAFAPGEGKEEEGWLLREAALYLYCKLARFGVDGALKEEGLEECWQKICREMRERPLRQPRSGPEAEAKSFTMRLLYEKMANPDMEEREAGLREQISAEYCHKLRRQQDSMQFLKKQYEAMRRQYELLSEQARALAVQVQKEREQHELRYGVRSEDPVYQRGRKYPNGTVLFGGTVMWARNFYKLHPNVVIYVGDGEFPSGAINDHVPLVLVNRERLSVAVLSKIRKLLRRYRVPYEFVGRLTVKNSQ